MEGVTRRVEPSSSEAQLKKHFVVLGMNMGRFEVGSTSRLWDQLNSNNELNTRES